MQRLFTRLYVQFFSTLVVILMIAALTIYLLARHQLKTYAEQRLRPVATVVSESWTTLDSADHINWLALVSGLTGTQWQQVETELLASDFVIEQLHLPTNTVIALIKLDEQTLIRVAINDWRVWEQGYGWLLLDAVSRVPSADRETRFQRLKAMSPWGIERINIQDDPLPPLALQQLINGQSIRVSVDGIGTEALYLPAGANRAIRFGPIRAYVFLSIYQWLAVVGISLIVLSISLMLWIHPLQRRFLQLFKAVDRISMTKDSIALPTDDPDELGQLARHIETMALNLIQQIDTNRQLNQAVSHDLKTPLARIRFSLALLSISDDDPYLANIYRDIDLLIQLTDELLLYHQLRESSPSVPACDVVSLLTEHVGVVPDAFTVTSDIPDAPLCARILPTHWLRLVDNLIKNAEQYGRGRLHVSLTRDNDVWVFTVEDNGPGLTAQELDLMKQPFQRQQSHRNLNQNNHGLGLALVDAAAQHYGGTFDCHHSTLGGAAMTVRLPATLFIDPTIT